MVGAHPERRTDDVLRTVIVGGDGVNVMKDLFEGDGAALMELWDVAGGGDVMAELFGGIRTGIRDGQLFVMY